MQEKIDKFSTEVLEFSERLLRDSQTVRTMTPDLPFYINTREHQKQRMDIRQRAEVAAELISAVPIKTTDSGSISHGNAEQHFITVNNHPKEPQNVLLKDKHILLFLRFAFLVVFYGF